MKQALILVACIALSACVYNQNTHKKYTGAAIPPQQIAKVEAGKTNKQWILANFGIPDRTQLEKDGLEVFEYVATQTEKKHKAFIFLFQIDSEKDLSHKVTRVVFKNGVVESIHTSGV